MSGAWLAVMEDATVLCADCLDDEVDERLAATAATIVHPWLADPSGETCHACGASDDTETGR